MSMLSKRLQVLVEPDLHRRLRSEARSRGTSVGDLVREAVEEKLGGASETEAKLALVDEMRAVASGPSPSLAELDRILDEQRRTP